jgi:hypothetical protein
MDSAQSGVGHRHRHPRRHADRGHLGFRGAQPASGKGTGPRRRQRPGGAAGTGEHASGPGAFADRPGRGRLPGTGRTGHEGRLERCAGGPVRYDVALPRRARGHVASHLGRGVCRCGRGLR